MQKLNEFKGLENKEIFHPDKFITPTEEVYRMKPGDIVKSCGNKRGFKYFEFVVDSTYCCFIIKSFH